jgi:hypothetical protein
MPRAECCRQPRVRVMRRDARSVERGDGAWQRRDADRARSDVVERLAVVFRLDRSWPV